MSSAVPVLSARPESGRLAWEHLAGARGWDRRPGLLDGEAAAITAIGPVGLRRNRATGVPRRTARHWMAIAHLVEPLDAARAAVNSQNCRSG